MLTFPSSSAESRMSSAAAAITVNLNIWETVSEMSQVICINEMQMEVFDLL